MVYSMSRNRYCERIGREHKSNHGIFFHSFVHCSFKLFNNLRLIVLNFYWFSHLCS